MRRGSRIKENTKSLGIFSQMFVKITLYLLSIKLLMVVSENILSYRCMVNQTIQVPASQTIRLLRTSPGSLCTLSQITAGSGFAPVARSYEGNDWEQVAGPYRTMPINCSQASCDIAVPMSNTPTTNFFLVSFDRLLPSVDAVARFLEQTTFGTTRSDIESFRLQSNNFTNLPRAFAEWVRNQIYNVNMTSHREFWRLRMASRQINEGHEGAPTHPCQAKSQWRRASFTEKDSFQIIQTTYTFGRFPLYVNGNLRTVVDQKFFQFNNISFNIELSMNFTLCQDIEDFVGGRLSLRIGLQSNCVTVKNGNPPINFTSSDPQPRFLVSLPDVASGNVVVSRYMMSSIPENMYISSNLSSETCKTIPLMICCNGQGSVFGQMSTGQYMIFDPRLVFRTNSIIAPLDDGGASTVLATDSNAQCANTPRTFLNEKTCYMSTVGTACSTSTVTDVSISLSASTVASFFNATARQLYIYIIDGLRIDDDLSVSPPCRSGTTSRWRRLQTGTCLTNVQVDTATVFQQLISQSTDSNPNVRDIYLQSKFSCNSLDRARMSLIIKIGSDCWTTTHPDNLNIYDFTYWTLNGTHPGNVAQADLGMANPIMKFALQGSSTLLYPESHPMERWQINKNIFPLIGRFNDTIAFSDLPDYLRQNYIALSFGLTSDSISAGRIVCGSPGEIANKVESLTSFDITRSPEQDTTSQEDFVQQRKTVWTMIALQSPDQLRQRMAWALSQLFAISPYSDPNTEIYLNYYDIFIRNAFGNYRDVLREVAYSPLMAKMLTYLGSQSQAFTWSSIHELKYADENFAREVMQLFSIGLFLLNTDGNPVLDDEGNYIRTYTNDDVMEYSRVWTGFTRQQARGNYEERLGLTNNLDPMTINVNWRDQFPKMGLNNQYVGDKYMLCSDLPPRSFLRTGATYRLLGSWVPDLSTLKVTARGFPSFKVFELNQTSPLFRKLCGQGNCTAALSVTLDQTLPCFGYECQIDMIQVVKLTSSLFYEYVRPACVNFPFFNSGSTTMNVKSASPQCVDSRLAVAAEICCSSTNAIYNSCMFSGERVNQATAKARCNAKSMSLCSTIPVPFPRGNCWNYNGDFWLNKSCGVNILVSPEGKIAIEMNSTSDFPQQMNTFFRVSWINGSFPSLSENSCGAGLCSRVGRLCRCSTFVVDKTAFTQIPSRVDALSQLNVGGVPPSMFDNGTYTLKATTSDGLWVYQVSKSIDNTTLFKVQDDYGRIMFLRNFQSVVYVRATSGFFASSSYGFRNPPVFYDAVANKGDAIYETEAALDHYFYNRNTAPFLAMNFIQKFGISNPSPRYIREVAKAFQNGIYTFSDNANSSINFGSATYGDLGATIAAIISDRESRSIVLDADPTQGSIREPLRKVIALMRNLEFKVSNDAPFTVLQNLQTKIGQMAHDIPSVFSFFLPQYSPPGLIQTSLVSPESMLLTHNVGLMNGMISLIKFGLTSCFNGFGVSRNQVCRSNIVVPNNSSAGWLSYTPFNPGNPNAVVDELATLLTSGRMSVKNRNIIALSYNSSKDALRVAEQLFVSAPEFHSTGLVRSNGTKRELESLPGTCKSHKAIVHILLKGGCDSYNMLVPHSQCQVAGTDLYTEYQNIRGTVALAKESLLPIQVTGNTQPCAVFGLHPSLPSLKKLYDEGSALFFANIGSLDRPVTNQNYMQQTTTQLFAHDAMQAEIGRLDPFQTRWGTGFLGRIVDYLYENNYKVNSFSLDAPLSNLAGELPVVTKFPVESSDGFRTYNPSGGSNALLNQTKELNDKGTVFSSVFSELWSASLQNAIDSSNNLFWAQQRGKVSTVFPSTDVGNQLKLVAEMINSNDCRKSDRDIFYIEVPGFDHHDSVLSLLQSRFDELNDGLSAFVSEMKLKNKWNDITVVSTSDFGRTLIGNSNEGTDHAWAGHTFMVGGSVRGQRILGQYPSDLSDDSPLSVGRGRLLPTLPWEAMWNAVAEWFDVNDNSALDRIFPNRRIFSSSLLHKSDVFKEVSPNFSSCSRRLSNAMTCEIVASLVNPPPGSTEKSPSGSLGMSPSGTPLDPSPTSVAGVEGNGNQPSYSSSHISKGKASDNNVASWLVPIFLITMALVAAGFYRRKLSAFVCSRLSSRFNRSTSEPKVIFFNAIDPNHVEVETGRTINMFERRPDFWAGYS